MTAQIEVIDINDDNNDASVETQQKQAPTILSNH